MMDIDVDLKGSEFLHSSQAKGASAGSATASVEAGTAQAAGCIVSWEDKPIILCSLACFISFITYGASMATLGASVPELAIRFGIDVSDFSVAFAFRGLGYLVGTVYSAAVLEGFYGISWAPSPWYKRNMLLMQCIMTLICGIGTILIVTSKSFPLMVMLNCVQGVSFGGIDTVGNVIMPHIWKARTQPWMQALHMCFGLGALIGPTLVGFLGLDKTLVILSCMSLCPLIIAGYYFYALPSASWAACWKHCGEVPGGEEEKEREGEGEGEGEEGKKGEGEGHRVLPTVEPIQPGDVPTAASTAAAAKPKRTLPRIYKALFATFFFVYVGAEAGFGSWITTYVLQKGVTVNTEQAAFIAAYYWAALTAGRALAIIEAVYMTASNMMILQLALALVGVILNNTILGKSYDQACAAAVLFGFALSSIFPLAMTVVGDYNYIMDASATAAFIVASSIGDGAVPWMVGEVMGAYGPDALPVSSLISVLVCICLYVFFQISVRYNLFPDVPKAAAAVKGAAEEDKSLVEVVATTSGSGSGSGSGTAV